MRQIRWILACMLGWSLVGCSTVEYGPEDAPYGSTVPFSRLPKGLPEGVDIFTYQPRIFVFRHLWELQQWCMYDRPPSIRDRNGGCTRLYPNGDVYIYRLVDDAYACIHEERHVIDPAYRHDQ